MTETQFASLLKDAAAQRIFCARPRFTREGLSLYLLLAHGIEIAPATLKKYATKRVGPPFTKVCGRPYYPRVGADQWIETRAARAA